MNEPQSTSKDLDTAMMKPEQIINNPNGTSTVLLPEGTASESDPVIREFSGLNGTGNLLEQIINFNTGGSDVFIADPNVLAQIGKIGAVFGAGDVGSQLASIDIKFTGANGTGSATSGDVMTKDGESYAFQLTNLPPGELVSVKEFSGPGETGNIEETIDVFNDGSIKLNMLAGSGLPNGVVAMQENFNAQGNLATVRTQESNGDVVVEAFHYDANGNEVSQTVETFNPQNQVVSSTTSAPSGPTPPKLGGESAVQSIIAALSSLNPPVPGSAVAAANISSHKVTLAASAH